MPLPALAKAPLGPPKVSAAIAGARIEDVTIETYGQTSPSVVRRYLSLRKGSLLDQSGVDRDFTNLRRLPGFIPRLVISQGSDTATATLHWIVMAKLLKPTDHPFYADQPLTAPIQGIGYILTSAPVDSRGSTFSSYSQLSRRANLVRILYTSPIAVNPVKGTETDVIVNTFGGRGVFRASQPLAINIYSWNTGAEAALLRSATNGVQFEVGIRETRSTTAQSTGIVSPYVFQTSKSPAHVTVLEAGYSHACPVPSSQWYPPYCHTQYRLEAFDALGWFGSTSEYQSYLADVAQYIAVGKSTLVLHGAESRTGGVVPDSFLVCAYVRAYPKAFCGTDAQQATAEFRLNDALPQVFKFAFFTETAASRLRGGTQAFALPTFQWHADSGVGIIFRNYIRVDIAYGSAGGRISVALQGQTY
ncbi:MAG TPA: hypothetical protein VMT95_07870 [Candidatus Binatia bacterium]|nr:hypothetical protein [Candidatus Binatia bacterium]